MDHTNCRCAAWTHGPDTPFAPGARGGIVTKVVVRATDKYGSPLAQNALVSLFSDLGLATDYAITADAPTAEFDQVRPGNCSVEVMAASYKMVREDIGYVNGDKVT